jgi:hypothetical protein
MKRKGRGGSRILVPDTRIFGFFLALSFSNQAIAQKVFERTKRHYFDLLKMLIYVQRHTRPFRNSQARGKDCKKKANV